MGVKKGADVKKRILTPAEERLLVLYKRMQEELVDVKATVKLDMSSYQESKLKPNESTLQDPKAQAAQVWAQTQMKQKQHQTHGKSEFKRRRHHVSNQKNSGTEETQISNADKAHSQPKMSKISTRISLEQTFVRSTHNSGSYEPSALRQTPPKTPPKTPPQTPPQTPPETPPHTPPNIPSPKNPLTET
eukprot:gene7781-640_t